MKKQFLFTAVIISGILFSCTKEKIETAPSNTAAAPQAVIGNTSNQKAIPPSLMQNLEGWFQFDGNLLDQTGKLNADLSSTGADLYTTDRNGVSNGAVKFTGRYGFTIDSVPLPTNSSVAAWVKYDNPNIIYSSLFGPVSFGQDSAHYFGYISTQATSAGVMSPKIDDHWHFLVSTYDGLNLRFYVDGNFVGDAFNPGTFNSGPGNNGFTYWVGNYAGDSFWQGSMDDLRFYSRTLSAKDVMKLYNL